MSHDLGPDKAPAQPKRAPIGPPRPGESQLEATRRTLREVRTERIGVGCDQRGQQFNRSTDAQTIAAVMPLQLTTAQLSQVMGVAQPIPPDLRGEYLSLVATSLAGRKFDDGDVYRACAAAVKTVMWNVEREAG